MILVHMPAASGDVSAIPHFLERPVASAQLQITASFCIRGGGTYWYALHLLTHPSSLSVYGGIPTTV